MDCYKSDSTFKEIVKSSYAFKQTVFEKDKRWNILEELYEKNFLNPINPDYNTLPKKIHQIWLGSPLPDRYKKLCDSWKYYNPQWEYKLWTDNNLDEIQIPDRKLFDSITNLGQKSDYLRYNILNQIGGVYVDTDFECLKSLDFLTYIEFITGVGYATELEIYIGFIASTPHHPIMEHTVHSMTHVGRRTVRTIFETTGSYFFTRNFFDIVQNYKERVVVLPTDYLYPFPNKSGHENKSGSKYIKDCSIAVHHWAVSWGRKENPYDWIQGARFQEIADWLYSPKNKVDDDYDKLANTVVWADLKDYDVIYTHISYAKQFLDVLRFFDKKVVLITHSCDRSVGDKIIKTVNGKVTEIDNYVLPDNLVKWYTKNVNIKNPRIESIPIGLENARWYPSIKKIEKMVNKLTQPKQYKNQAYLNINIDTNPDKRSVLYTLFKNKSWVTAESGKNGQGYDDYLNNIYNHNFVFCPEGNGIDTHRTWEALCMHSIPIEKRNINNQFYTDLPICFVDDWNEVTENFLKSEYIRISQGKWNLEKLSFEYWKNKIHGNI
jgi:mannosyltransferase OCH1-like enzyme